MKKEVKDVSQYIMSLGKRAIETAKRTIPVEIGSIIVLAFSVCSSNLDGNAAEIYNDATPKMEILVETSGVNEEAVNIFEEEALNLVDTFSDEWIQQLERFRDLPDNWDGEGGRSVNPQTIDNCANILRAVAFANHYFESISVTELGSLCLLWYDKVSDGILNAEVGRSKMSFYAHLKGEELFDYPSATLNEESISALTHWVNKFVESANS